MQYSNCYTAKESIFNICEKIVIMQKDIDNVNTN
jgi:hypothetical protein